MLNLQTLDFSCGLKYKQLPRRWTNLNVSYAFAPFRQYHAKHQYQVSGCWETPCHDCSILHFLCLMLDIYAGGEIQTFPKYKGHQNLHMMPRICAKTVICWVHLLWTIVQRLKEGWISPGLPYCLNVSIIYWQGLTTLGLHRCICLHKKTHTHSMYRKYWI